MIMKFNQNLKKRAKQFISQVIESIGKDDNRYILKIIDHFEFKDGTITVYEFYDET